MAGVVTPKVPDQNDILLGEGIFYKNYVASGTNYPIGATRGGGTFNVERVIRNVNFDGQFGAVKGLNRKVTVVPSFTVNLLTINYVNMAYGMAVTVTDEGDYHQVIEDLEIDSGDYMDDVTFVGEKMDGKNCIIIIQNVLATSPTNLTLAEKDEAVNNVVFTGHYGSATPTTVPYSIRDYDV